MATPDALAKTTEATSVELALRCNNIGMGAAGCGAEWSERVPMPIRVGHLAQRLLIYRCPHCGSDAHVEFYVRTVV